jgi:hypothetical protein
VNLIALPTRFVRIWRTRRASASATTPVSPCMRSVTGLPPRSTCDSRTTSFARTGEVDLRARELELPALDRAELEDVVDELEEVRARAADLLDLLARVRR